MIPVVIAFTSNYLIPAATLIHSVLRSSGASFEFICLIGEKIPDSHKKCLETLSQGRAIFKYIESVTLPDNVFIDPKYTAAAEYRLMLPELLMDYDKVLYIDCDVIVRNDLALIFDGTELTNKLIGAVYERPGYFNSGFLLMNLAKMRKEKTSARLLEALKTDFLEFPDQDVLNMVCGGAVLALPPYCNGIRTFWLPQFKNDFLDLFSEGEYEEMLAHGNIHYTGGKPWTIYTVRFGDWWNEYFSLPKEIRVEWQPSPKIHALARLYSNRIGRNCLESVRNFYRKIKYRV